MDSNLERIKKKLDIFTLANMISSYSFIYLNEKCRLCPIKNTCNIILKNQIKQYKKTDNNSLLMNSVADRQMHYCFIRIYKYLKQKNNFAKYIEKLTKNDIIKLIYSLRENFLIGENCKNIDNNILGCPIYEYCNKEECDCKKNVKKLLNGVSHTQKKNRDSKKLCSKTNRA